MTQNANFLNGDLSVTQMLSTGLTIRQDFRKSVRAVMFENDHDEFKYTSGGGTSFLVQHRGRCYALTCRHSRGSYSWNQLAISNTRFGRNVAGIGSVYSLTGSTGEAVDSELVHELAVVEFSDDVGTAYFNHEAYLLDRETVGTSHPGDILWTTGALKENSTFLEQEIRIEFARLEFEDAGMHPTDITMRKAIAKYENLRFQSLAGMSGSPVFNSTQRKLCGMITRGRLSEGRATIYYIDMEDILRAIEAISGGSFATSYQKPVLQLRQIT